MRRRAHHCCAIEHRSIRYRMPSPVFLSGWLNGLLSDTNVGKGLAPSGSMHELIAAIQCGKARGKRCGYYEFALRLRLSYHPPPEGDKQLPYVLIEHHTVYPADKQQFGGGPRAMRDGQ